MAAIFSRPQCVNTVWLNVEQIWTHKDSPDLTLVGELRGVYCEYCEKMEAPHFVTSAKYSVCEENRVCYDETTLYNIGESFR